MSEIEKAGRFKLGDRTVKRMGYGAMQLAGPGVFGPPKDRAGASPCCARRSPAASTISTPATSTARMSPTRSSARRCTPTRRTSSSSPRSAPGAARTRRGTRHSRRSRADAGGRMTICAISGSTCWRSSICASCRHPRPGRRARSRRRSRVSPSCSGKGPSSTSGSATSPRSRSPRARAFAKSSACRTSTISPIATTMR